MKHAENKQLSNNKPANIGQYIRRAREQRGWSLSRLADAVGLHHSYLSRVESGSFRPSPEKLQRIAVVLELNYEDLFAIAGYHVPEGLPSFVPYLRAKYDMSQGDTQRFVEYFDRLRREQRIAERRSPEITEPDEDIDPKLAKEIEEVLRDVS